MSHHPNVQYIGFSARSVFEAGEAGSSCFINNTQRFMSVSCAQDHEHLSHNLKNRMAELTRPPTNSDGLTFEEHLLEIFRLHSDTGIPNHARP